ncbi:uncharacterized protein At5g39570-like [Juglans microcarpa x Juglans regia]|uniref:uncharacterized protein At5g39570-like n=1 Tax=Juglans microcarpa x Juglans regia TaxID=2249226 RepID=UPI001B7E5161|nr:uncharacterized protein At5g39570-like [Juglans microcarpa x Juglans regia]
MSNYAQGSEDEVDDFDQYEPTPYGGGYDIVLTYDRPLPPSDETCYHFSSSMTSNDFDYDHPQYTSYAEPSTYRDEALETVYNSYARPKPRPSPPPPGEGDFRGGEYGARLDIGHGFPPPGVNRSG